LAKVYTIDARDVASGIGEQVITVRLIQQGREILVAACDKELLGKTYREGDIKLEVSKDFYEGEDGDEELLISRLNMCTMANLVGEHTCKIASKHKFIEEDCVMLIQGVPHAQMIRW
jgi:hypothetical protein